MSLALYRKKRDFKKTAEPAGGGRRGGGVFVVQLHHASHRHFDFRLELDGVLKSWAVPKGPSFDPAVKRLAVEVEDHPLAYASFAGDIAEGNYGAGHVDIFDEGTWQPLGDARAGLARGDLKFELHGDVLRGSWVLVRTRLQGGKQQWLLIKHRDEFAGSRDAGDFIDPKTDRPLAKRARRSVWSKRKPIAGAAKAGVEKQRIRTTTATKSAKSAQTRATTARSAKPARTSAPAAKPVKPARTTAAAGKSARPRRAHAVAPPPTRARAVKLQGKPESIRNEAFAPELCKLLASPPDGDDWVHEIKWDGYRILATVVAGRVRLWSRNAIEWTSRLPELVAALESLKLKNAQLDGEMIVEREGRDNFNALQSRLSAEVKDPLLYMLFDMPHQDGRSLRELPLLARKDRLRALVGKHPHDLLRFSEHTRGQGRAVFAQATAAGYEGIVSKKADSAYHGTRNGDWVKVKGRPSDEFVVVGFTEPKGSRSDLGALLLGQYREGVLTYVGRVGTGLDDRLRQALRKTLQPLRIGKAPADTALIARRDRELAIWVRPKLVVEAYFQGIGGQGLLRQPAFKALRTDKRVEDLMTMKNDKATKAAKATKAKPRKTPVGATSTPAKASVAKAAPAAAVAITHPERVVFPELGVTKAEVAEYYRAIAPLLLADAAGRPLSVVRCPDGAAKTCFFQKHVGQGWGKHIRGVPIAERGGSSQYLCIDDAAGLLELVQMNVLEIHPWGATAADPEHADRIIFDLDPHASIRWPQMVAAARLLRDFLKTLNLESFVRTSGGKGLHVVVPLRPAIAWSEVKEFARAVAEAMAHNKPEDFVSVAGEKKRTGKIFVDWLRNAHGATSVASYSLRARPSAGVAMPLGWDEIARVKGGDAFTIKNALRKIRTRSADPWAGIDKVKQKLPKTAR